MVVSSSTLSLIPGRHQLTVTLVPLNGFNLPISLSCSGLPQGHNLQLQSRQRHSQRRAGKQHGDSHAPDSTGARTQAGSAWCARGTTGLRLGDAVGIHLVVGPKKMRKRSPIAQWWFRLAVAAALTAASLWVSGCGYSANTSGGKFTLTLTASASNAETHTSQVTVLVQQ